MATELTLKKSISIQATSTEVWMALTDPELIKVYFFGTRCISDWKKGSSILFQGTWEGKSYEDKGTIIDIEPERFIHYNYWSSFSGTEDKPENYSEIKYELSALNNQTQLTISQSGFKTPETRDHSDKNWGYVMEGLRNLLENKLE